MVFELRRRGFPYIFVLQQEIYSYQKEEKWKFANCQKFYGTLIVSNIALLYHAHLLADIYISLPTLVPSFSFFILVMHFLKTMELSSMKFLLKFVVLLLLAMMIFMGSTQGTVPACCRYNPDCCQKTAVEGKPKLPNP